MRDDWESSQAALLRVEVIHEGAEAIITVEGELTQLTAERFVACVLEALDTKPRSITVDAQGVTFTDSSGLSALLRARGLAFVDRVAFRIKDPPPQLRQLVQVSGTEDLLLPDGVTRGEPGTPAKPPARPYPGSSGRLSGGPSRSPREIASTTASVTG
jgi:anti-sigma B factor antagonist